MQIRETVQMGYSSMKSLTIVSGHLKIRRLQHEKLDRSETVWESQSVERSSRADVQTFGLGGHRPVVHIGLLTLSALLRFLLAAHSHPQAFEFYNDLVAMEEKDVGNCSEGATEDSPMQDGIGSTQVGGRVVHALIVIGEAGVIDGTGYVVDLTETVRCWS